MKIQARNLAIAIAIAGPLGLAAASQASAAPTDGISIKAAVPAVTTDVRYRVYYTYPSYWGYPTYYYYGYPNYGAYSPYWRYPQYYAYSWW